MESRTVLTDRRKEGSHRISDEILNALSPLVWASKTPEGAKNVAPVKVNLIAGSQPVRKKQNPLNPEAKVQLEP